MIEQVERTLESREVAEMIEKTHSELLKDIRRYIGQFNAGNLPFVEFFRESTYTDGKGETRPCYQITRKGCEFIAHKLTGTKGTIFTARYINRFHEMQNILQEQEAPWFIRKFQGDYIMLFRDFKSITGVEMSGNYTAYKKSNRLIGGLEYNGWGWKCDNEKFRQQYGFDYGEEPCMFYLYLCGIPKALSIYREDERNWNAEAHQTILEGYRAIGRKKIKQAEIPVQKKIIINERQKNEWPIQINIVVHSDVESA